MLPEFRYQKRRPISPKSWGDSIVLGADTETIGGKAAMLTLESCVKENYIMKTVEVESLDDILGAMLDEGYVYAATKKFKNGGFGRKWFLSTPNWFYWNLKYDAQAILKHLPDEVIDVLYLTGETKYEFNYKGETGTVKIKYLEGKYMCFTFEGITFEKNMNLRPDNKKLFTDRFKAVIAKIMKDTDKTLAEAIKEEAKRYTVAPASAKKWLTGSQPQCAKIREAIMKRGSRLVKEEIKTQTIQVQLSPIELWDAAQFYKMPLTVAGKKYLGVGKMETCFDGTKLDVSRLEEMIWVDIGYGFEPREVRYWDYYKADILKYADLDGNLCGQLARRIKNEFVDNGIRFKKAYSPANVGQQALMSTGYDQTINLMESNKKFKQLMEKADTSYHGGRFECSRIGYFKDMVGVDLVSAYWYVLYHLPAIMQSETVNKKRVESVDGKIIKGNLQNMSTWDEWMEQRNPYSIGFIDVKVLFQECEWYPLVDNAKTTLVGTQYYEGTICADEYAEMLLWNPISVETGTWIYHKQESDVRPFREIMTKCLEQKMSCEKGSAGYNVAKVVGSSLYGKTSQKIDDIMGGMWNSCYSSTITGGTRARLAEIIRLNSATGYPIMVATDGCIFAREDLKVIPKRPVCDSEAPDSLGEWEIEETGDCLVIGSGLYSFVKIYEPEIMQVGYDWIPIKPKTTHKTAVRGDGRAILNKSPYDNWYDFCNGHLEETEVVATANRPLSLGQVGWDRKLSLDRVAAGKPQLHADRPEPYTYDNMNIFVEEPISIRPCTESLKRIPVTRPATFSDLLSNQYVLAPHYSVEHANTLARREALLQKLLEKVDEE